jgi:hypothetical protein
MEFLQNPKIRFTLVYPDGRATDIPGEVSGNFTGRPGSDREWLAEILLHDAPKGTTLENLRVVDENWEEIPEQPEVMRPYEGEPKYEARGTRKFAAAPKSFRRGEARPVVSAAAQPGVKRAAAPTPAQQAEAEAVRQKLTGGNA